MAPCKVKPSASLAWYEPALDAPNVLEKSLASTCLLMAGESNEWGKTELRAASVEPEPEGSTFSPFFMRSIATGLVPPFSDFFYSVLSHCKIHALHLHPNSILLLSIFAFYCEAYVGVMTSVALLRHFFFLRIKEGYRSGCVSFVTANKTNAISKAGKKAEGFRSKWVLMDAKCSHPGWCCRQRCLRPKRGGFTRSSLTLG